MQSQKTGFDADVSQAAEQRLIEVQPGCRRCDCPGCVCIDRLVATPVINRIGPVDIWRQGDMAASFQDLEYSLIALEFKLKKIIQALTDLTCRSIFQVYPTAGFGCFACTQLCQYPVVIKEPLDQ